MNKIRPFTAFVFLVGGLVAMMSTLHASEKGSAHWSYEGAEGPEHWGELIDAYRMCSEGVKWIVLKTPIEASARQIAIFKERVGEATNRPIQPHNARLIVD